MKNPPTLATPSTWLNACLLWLLTNSIGAASLLIIDELSHLMSSETSAIMEFAAIGSLVIISLAVPAFRYLLAINNRSYRLLAALGTVALFFLLPTMCLTFLFGRTAHFLRAIDELVEYNA